MHVPALHNGDHLSLNTVASPPEDNRHASHAPGHPAQQRRLRHVDWHHGEGDGAGDLLERRHAPQVLSSRLAFDAVRTGPSGAV